MDELPLFPELLEPERSEAEGEARAETEARPADWSERQRALDVTQSWIVEAPAGSGKTGLLLQRYLKLLGDESVTEPEQVLAITFTKAATEEIRERIVQELEGAGVGGEVAGPGFGAETRRLARRVLERSAERGWGLQQRSYRMRVRTIDGVCAEIARSVPVLTSGAGQRTPRESAGELYRRAARQTLLAMGGADARLSDSVSVLLLHRDGNVADCEGLIAGMLASREQWRELLPAGDVTDEALEREVLPRLNQSLEQVVCGILSEVRDAFPEELLGRVNRVAAEMGQMEAHGRVTSPMAICAGKELPPEARVEHLEHWRALVHLLVTPSSKDWRKSFLRNHVFFDASKAEQARLKELVEEVQMYPELLGRLCNVLELPPAVYPEEQWVVAKSLFRVLAEALRALEAVFAEAGACDFAEIAILARRALAAADGVAQVEAATGEPLQHLLIDEMQDTSTSQYALIERLIAGWTGTGRTVFLVGDPKQSLYLFRQARVERFVQTMRRGELGGVALGRIQLTENFRSRPRLIEQGNESFRAMFPRREEATQPEQVPFVAATAARPSGGMEGEEMGMVWHPSMLPPVGGVREQAREEAKEVREVLARWRAKPLPEGRSEPWRMAVLVRARADVWGILAALRDPRGGEPIPFRAVKIDPLKERQEVLDLHALTRALLHPADRLAWLAVLRAPWCGLGLAELHRLTGADDARFRDWTMEALIEQHGDLLGEESCRRLERIWTVMGAAQRRVDVRVAERVERSWRVLGGDAFLSVEERANTRQYLEMLGEAEEVAGVVNVRDLEGRMEGLYAEPAAVEGAVEVMTIHTAKGLEWDMVVVPGLGREAPAQRDPLLVWEELTLSGGAAAGLVVAPVKGRGEDSKELNGWLRGLRARREAAERKRVFYVAATRAREELHLFGAARRRSRGGFAPDAGSLLQAAWGAAKAYFPKDAAEMTLRFPAPEREVEQGEGLALAATVGAEAQTAMIQRLPMEFGSRREAGEAWVPRGGEGERQGERPEGSMVVRSFGNAVHAFLELAARRYAEGLGGAAILREAGGWTARVETVLRQEGFAPRVAESAARRVLTAVMETIRDPVGEWILGARAESVMEGRRAVWVDGGVRSMRVDRSFRAGPEPIAEGGACRWIIDYKTSTHAAEGMDRFLEQQKEVYRGQMERYGRALRREGEEPVRLGLYFVMLRRLVWWVAEEGPGVD